ncbi:phosphate transport system substrate-binding protein [Sphingomonas jejuensis]|uniref:Phosphate transport system substrate-binding protein n=1 Tax=Sphingomonas jejuensis TaxID=904715 RepID=A0ABX0XLD4_9SPHN|nr:substrate-binding domain-containing protein [Sphingomonas jejuensis]NJC34045.1 phosphate transport system substrate-binding protein [Sphingomonas jejuensis]
MRLSLTSMLPALSAVGLAVSLGGCIADPAAEGGEPRDRIRIVGSSTVYPFTTAVAEGFVNHNPGFEAPIVEQNGTGAGISLFCEGVGARFPDIANASRRMKPAELASCRQNGVTEVVELLVGIDGVAIAESRRGTAIALTTEQVYRALAAEPYGRPNTTRLWSDVDPALPNIPIVVYGPPSTSGTRDALVELIIRPGCLSNPAMVALEASDKDRAEAICTRLREDGPYVSAGENDNLIVQRLNANPDAVGIFGFSFLEENARTLRGVPINGVEPSAATIADGTYPGARSLYIYVKKPHMAAVPGMREFIAEFAGAWNPGGYLTRRGMIPAPADQRAASLERARTLPPLTPSDLGEAG